MDYLAVLDRLVHLEIVGTIPILENGRLWMCLWLGRTLRFRARGRMPNSRWL
jgi:hypothetical protein